MTEVEIIEAIQTEVRDQPRATSAAMRMVEEGLKVFPNSARLWILRGDLIQLSDEDSLYSLADVLTSYKKALEHAPDNPEAYEAIGHFLDAVEDKPAEAEPYFRKAISLGGAKTARVGLARVLEQLEHPE